MDTKSLAVLSFLGATIAGSGIPVFSKIILREISPAAMMALRFLIASAAFLPFVWRSLPKKSVYWLKISAATFPAAVNMVLFSNGVKFTSATMASLIYSLCPIVAAIILYFRYGEKLSRRKTAGIAIGLIGMLILITASLGNNGSIFGTLKGNLLILAGMFCWTIYTVASNRLENFRSSTITFTLLLNGFLLNFLVGGFRILNLTALAQISLISWVWLIYLGLICSVGFFWLYQLAIKHNSAVSALMIGYIQPVVNFIWAAAILGERLNAVLIIAGALTLTGAYLTTTKFINLPRIYRPGPPRLLISPK